MVEVVEMVEVVLADAMWGVRQGLRWLLRDAPVSVVGEAGTVAEALAAPGAVVVSGLHFPDGTAADLCAAARPVVVYTWLPPDEHTVDLSGAAVVLRAGTLRAGLAAAVGQAGEPADRAEEG